MEKDLMLSLTIHGVRGSMPATGKKFSKYGGNTTCFEIETPESQIFIDAGTGFSSAKIEEDKKKYIFFLLIYITIICRGYCLTLNFLSESKK